MTETRRQRVPLGATMGGLPAVGVVQTSEDVPFPLIYDVCGGSRPGTTVAVGRRQWRRAENERKQTLRHPGFSVSRRYTKGGNLEQATRRSPEITRQFGLYRQEHAPLYHSRNYLRLYYSAQNKIK